MTNKQLFPICICALVVLSISSCKKDSDDDSSKSRQELLIGTWQMSAMVENPIMFDYDGDGTKDQNVFLHLESCEKDNLFTFLANGTYTENEGATKCDPGDPQDFGAGTWSISADEKTLIADGETVTIADLNTSTLTLIYTANYQSTDYTQTATYSRK